MPLLGKITPMLGEIAPKVLTPLAQGALSGLSNLRVNKLFGSGSQGGFSIQPNKVDQLMPYLSCFTMPQNGNRATEWEKA